MWLLDAVSQRISAALAGADATSPTATIATARALEVNFTDAPGKNGLRRS
jgi:hypothetical protein